eukprot:4888926-Amphidinium_carterae.2
MMVAVQTDQGVQDANFSLQVLTCPRSLCAMQHVQTPFGPFPTHTSQLPSSQRSLSFGHVSVGQANHRQ